jgi:hypothetical protein
MFTKIASQFRKVLYKWTPQEAKLLHGLKNLFQALPNIHVGEGNSPEQTTKLKSGELNDH